MIDLNTQKKLSKDILLFFDQVCREKKIKYYLAYGTLLGAVRHNGFIPWDDDIDVMMPRADYERLFAEFPEHPYYKVMNIKVNPDYGRLYGVINDIRTVKQEKLLRRRSNKTMAVNIDIFPLDSLPDNEVEQIDLLKKVRKIENKLACLTYAYGKGQTFFSTIKKNIAIAVMRTLETIGIVSIPKLYAKHSKLLQSSPQSSNVIGMLASTRVSGMKAFLSKTYFDEIIELDFENHKFLAPKGYDGILSQLYGNYMELPPKEKRITHHSSICNFKHTN